MTRPPVKTATEAQPVWVRDLTAESDVLRAARDVLRVPELATLAGLGLAEATNATGRPGERSPAREEMAAKALAALDADVVDDAAHDLCELFADPRLETEELPADLRGQVQACLVARDAVELALAGGRIALGDAFALTDEQTASLGAFENLVRPELWRLVPLNDMRNEALRWIAPAHRATFWWWSDGADLPTDALDGLSVAAQLLLRFPGARKQLERLVEAQKLLDAGGASAELGELLSLFGGTRPPREPR